MIRISIVGTYNNYVRSHGALDRLFSYTTAGGICFRHQLIISNELICLSVIII